MSIAISDVDDPAVKAQLKLYDVDADGSVSVSELVAALQKHQSTKNTARNLKYILAICAVLVAILVALTSVSTWAIVDGSKDTETHNNELTSRSTGETMSVKQSQVSIPFGALHKLDPKLLKLSEIQFRDEGTGVVYVKQTSSFDVFSNVASPRVRISCTDGTKIEVIGMQNAIATLPEGQEVFFCASCSGCGLRSASTSDVLNVIEEYAEELATWAPSCTAARNMYLNRTGQFNATEEGTSDRRRFFGPQWLRGGCILSYVPCGRKSTFKWVNDQDVPTLNRRLQTLIAQNCPNMAGVCPAGKWDAIQARCVKTATKYAVEQGKNTFDKCDLHMTTCPGDRSLNLGHKQESCLSSYFDTYFVLKPQYRQSFANAMSELYHSYCQSSTSLNGPVDFVFGTKTFKDVCASNGFASFYRRNDESYVINRGYYDNDQLTGDFMYFKQGCTSSEQALSDFQDTFFRMRAQSKRQDTTSDYLAMMLA
eukprot:TRINITY_DN10090_c0_g1_i1.p1 TRINITY_DN10090_c0_g1~~TRINITY_DN10090_c0_g1_i1.p1  ORF type:complete len:482 (+),score=97.03 TRINITY_DN10090_c0_g1_i1:122-1567(+)